MLVFFKQLPEIAFPGIFRHPPDQLGYPPFTPVVGGHYQKTRGLGFGVDAVTFTVSLAAGLPAGMDFRRDGGFKSSAAMKRRQLEGPQSGNAVM